MATSIPEPTVEDAIDETIAAITNNGNKRVVLREEAERIVAELSEHAPKALIKYFSDHAVAIIREQLQIRLAYQRRNGRNSAFASRMMQQESDEITPANPFARRHPCEGNVWKRVGDMVRSDWKFQIEARKSEATASLLELALAKRIAARLPDDDTKTSEALSVAEFQALERTAEQVAKEEVAAFTNDED